MRNLALLLLLPVSLCGFTAAQPKSSRSIEEICKDSRPDCPQAVEFFAKFQEAIKSDKREIVASLAHYPLRVSLSGKSTFVRDKRELLRDYDRVFDAAVRCSILRAHNSDVWGNWQGFTIKEGTVWWEASGAAGSSFKLITVNNEAYYSGCGTGNSGGQKRSVMQNRRYTHL